jgi:hypothetical protein
MKNTEQTEIRSFSLGKEFSVDDRVKFDINGTEELKGTGSVLGQGTNGVAPAYIVLLDIPIMGQKAILIQASLMEKI